MSPGLHAPTKPEPAHRKPVVRGRPIVFGYVPALDGLRAISVLGVMLYHGGAPFMSGGFLTIDVFFVLSGFLITSLLLGEWAKRMTIRLGQFWGRRARRLLPALLVMLVGVAVFAKVFATPGEFADLRLDSLSTLFYVSNWHFIVSGGNYFASDLPTVATRTCGRSRSKSSSTSCGRRWPSSCSTSVGACGPRDTSGRSLLPRWLARSPRRSTCDCSTPVRAR